MKSVIPFSKELEFTTKLSEITSISLEREFEVQETSILGNLFVTGDYKSHEVSANVIPFSFKIPFSIEIPENLDSSSITLEISDFAYDVLEDNKIKVNIELELDGTVIEPQEEQEDEEEENTVDTEELIRYIEEKEETEDEEEVITEGETTIDMMSEEEQEKNIEEVSPQEEQTVRNQEEDLILENISNEEEFTTYHIHMVKEGESIETICTMYNSNVNLLSDYNDLNNVVMGEKLIIPVNDES